jgi:hypothetical protein
MSFGRGQIPVIKTQGESRLRKKKKKRRISCMQNEPIPTRIRLVTFLSFFPESQKRTEVEFDDFLQIVARSDQPGWTMKRKKIAQNERS